METTKFTYIWFYSILILEAIYITSSQPFIGINYGEVANNLPPPSATSRLLQTTTIQKLRLYTPDPSLIQSLSNTSIQLIIGVPNSDIPQMATDPEFSKAWITSNIVPFYPSSNIFLISVGNEVLTLNDRSLKSLLLPAMKNLRDAVENTPTLSGGKIKISTVHSMGVIKRSEPPSAAIVDRELSDLMRGILEFSNGTGSPFAVNPYPYFAYRSDPRDETLAFCLFKPNVGRYDGRTGIKYTNMFDAQVDGVRSAVNKMGFEGIEIVVAETGWPYKGDNDEVGANIENAKAYNQNLIAHLRSMVGTPLMPGKSVDTYLFALYDENLKPGPVSERYFGIFKPDLTMVYDVSLSKNTQVPRVPTIPGMPKSPVIPKPNPISSSSWCVPKIGVTESQLQPNIDYACGHNIDCRPIMLGGSCFQPNNMASHAAYAMNLYYQTFGRTALNCDFSTTGTITQNNPSYSGCIYPGGV